jgi:hypothetical protein
MKIGGLRKLSKMLQVCCESNARMNFAATLVAVVALLKVIFA